MKRVFSIEIEYDEKLTSAVSLSQELDKVLERSVLPSAEDCDLCIGPVMILPESPAVERFPETVRVRKGGPRELEIFQQLLDCLEVANILHLMPDWITGLSTDGDYKSADLIVDTEWKGQKKSWALSSGAVREIEPEEDSEVDA